MSRTPGAIPPSNASSIPDFWVADAVLVNYVRNEYHGDAVFHAVEHGDDEDSLSPVAVCGERSIFYPHHEWPRIWDYAWPPKILCEQCVSIRQQRMSESFAQNVDRLLGEALDPACHCSPAEMTFTNDVGEIVHPDPHRRSMHLNGLCSVPGCICRQFKDRDIPAEGEPVPEN